MMATQLEGKTVSSDDELGVLHGIVKHVGLILLAKVSGL
jgi:hypothetical protein